MTREDVTMLVKKALREGPFSMREFADAEGMSYGVMRAWSTGRRTPEPANLSKLAEGLRRRAAALQALAAELEQAAGEAEG